MRGFHWSRASSARRYFQIGLGHHILVIEDGWISEDFLRPDSVGRLVGPMLRRPICWMTWNGIDRMSSQPPVPPVHYTASRYFASWLVENDVSLLATTYESGMLFMIGTRQDGQLSCVNRAIARCTGLAVSGGAIWIGTLFQIWRFQNTLAPGTTHRDFDRFYAPRVAWSTGDIDVHDLGIDGAGRPVFVNTSYSCLATVDEEDSFIPLWKPPFISSLVREDRCHLNGLAMIDGSAIYATCIAASDEKDGWRTLRRDGGLLMHIPSNEIVASGLSMPHSPRWHAGKLWLHNSGTGEFGFVEPDAGRFVPVAFCPGYLRGLSFVAGFAVIGLSIGRDETFGSLPLQHSLAQKGVVARCAIQIVDLASGDVPHELRIMGEVRELYDTAVLVGVRRPGTIEYMSDEFLTRITFRDTLAVAMQ